MNADEKVNWLKARLLQVYNRYGQLTHPEVVNISQQLDRALNELELHRRKTRRRSESLLYKSPKIRQNTHEYVEI
ncbi:aspartyl-phosphate phosphatase Spo0E family protein [Paenibacillus cremeus]|uniref:Aspartyl-phosphate phosphatase Spo0E family protein n=1 Tax=Paenibacillus cremeus TaxID=2163881 RepID=A0A559K7H5_9BACL|nr:aspartyl-phosphate phosphatase Spo0E family protein [Paenibacillus cremeus]TVY08067.1 aspartyl-phosphate phosphatase Spo0E family protein [Paenibacillus cremeus]